LIVIWNHTVQRKSEMEILLILWRASDSPETFGFLALATLRFANRRVFGLGLWPSRKLPSGASDARKTLGDMRPYLAEYEWIGLNNGKVTENQSLWRD